LPFGKKPKKLSRLVTLGSRSGVNHRSASPLYSSLGPVTTVTLWTVRVVWVFTFCGNIRTGCLISHWNIYCYSNTKLQCCTLHRTVAVRICSTETSFHQFVYVCLSTFSGKENKKTIWNLRIYTLQFLSPPAQYINFESVGKLSLCANMAEYHWILCVFYLGCCVYVASNNGLVSECLFVCLFSARHLLLLEASRSHTTTHHYR
jgi:hypothetical protein